MGRSILRRRIDRHRSLLPRWRQAHREVLESLVWFVEGLDQIHARTGRTFVAKRGDVGDRVRRPFDDRLHLTVDQVPHPTGDARRLGDAACGLTEKHALNQAVDDQTRSNAVTHNPGVIATWRQPRPTAPAPGTRR